MQSAYGYLFTGQLAKALRNFGAAYRYSPFDTRAYTIFAGTSMCHLFAGRYNEAIQWAERAIDKSPNFAVALRSLTIALVHDGRLEDAREAAKRLIAAQPNASIAWTLQRPFGMPWMMDMWVDGLRRAGIPERACPG
jgi:adenylate cyclase